MISDESSLADDWSITSLSLLVTNASYSSSFSSALSELFSRTISFGGKNGTEGNFLFNFSATVLQDSLITVRATDLSSALSFS